AADLPERTAGLSAIDEGDARAACRRERAPDLENPDGARVAETVEGECSRQLSRRREAIDARCEGEPTQIGAGQVDVARLAGEGVVGRGGRALGRERGRIPRVYRSGHDSRTAAGAGSREPRAGGAGADAQIAIDGSRARIGHRGGPEDSEAPRRTETGCHGHRRRLALVTPSRGPGAREIAVGGLGAATRARQGQGGHHDRYRTANKPLHRRPPLSGCEPAETSFVTPRERMVEAARIAACSILNTLVILIALACPPD